ncbi:hypothetical protein GIB67_037262 [Kingdonia uniflora]|uniref:Uncharacterized protein n=1 Tax=Kingdonia uniflora TaxID=39325 RepID=A0A7J7MRX0_9MAGN|nr:hypothetical protein GIB67_037262 [Kingdonia uniflora]
MIDPNLKIFCPWGFMGMGEKDDGNACLYGKIPDVTYTTNNVDGKGLSETQKTLQSYEDKVKGTKPNSISLDLIPNPTLVGDRTLVPLSQVNIQKEVDYFKFNLIGKLPMLSITLEEINLTVGTI